MDRSVLSSSRRWRVSRWVAIGAMVLWLSSLYLGGLMPDSTNHQMMMGWDVLLIGWMGLLLFNAAWLANLSLLLAFLRVLWHKTRSSPVFLALAGCVLALDMLRFDTFYEGEPVSLYGYGWGAVLWLVAMCVMLVAAGLQARELDQARWLQRLGVWGGTALAVLSLAGAGVDGMLDRRQPNRDERAVLAKGVAFKRGPVCRIEPQVRQRMALGDGVLEIAAPAEGLTLPDPFMRQPVMLDLGVEVLRMGGRDYRWYDTGGDVPQQLLLATPAQAAQQPSRVLLQAGEAADGTLSLVLRAQPGGQTLLDERWPRHTATDCPRPAYRTELLRQALDLQSRPLQRNFRDAPFLRSHIVAQEGSPLPSPPLDLGQRLPPRKAQTRNCPAHVALQAYQDVDVARLGTPLAVGQTLYYLPWQERQAWCAGDEIYTMYSYIGGDDFVLALTRRQLSDMRITWLANVLVPDERWTPYHPQVVIERLHEQADGLEMTLSAPGQDVRMHIQVPWQAEPK